MRTWNKYQELSGSVYDPIIKQAMARRENVGLHYSIDLMGNK